MEKWGKISTGVALIACVPVFDKSIAWQAICIVVGLVIIIHGWFFSKTKFQQFRAYLNREIARGHDLIEIGSDKLYGLEWHGRTERNLSMALHSLVLEGVDVPGGKMTIPNDFSMTKHDFNSVFEEVTVTQAIKTSIVFLEVFKDKVSAHQLRESFEESDLEE